MGLGHEPGPEYPKFGDFKADRGLRPQAQEAQILGGDSQVDHGLVVLQLQLEAGHHRPTGLVSGILAAVVDQQFVRAQIVVLERKAGCREPRGVARKELDPIHPEARAQVKVEHGPEGEDLWSLRFALAGESRLEIAVHHHQQLLGEAERQEVRRGQGGSGRDIAGGVGSLREDPARFAGEVEVHHVARGVGERGLVNADLRRGRDLTTAAVPGLVAGAAQHPAFSSQLLGH